ncbi:MAG TPA: rRNA maturation RNase YbeY [Caldithrix abyssi]|uniref:Endoribonuclease YbeY n=1 Tax=Caldithrix abyssi TaxID=187145 RepID=A0A7V4TZG3_CALAY|nr:rRNA maturation RNase YbeY [Caldithrix abyssi]
MEIQIHRLDSDWWLSREKIESVVKDTCTRIELQPLSIQVIFTNDADISALHQNYLSDPTPTDIITFNLGENDEIEGEIYISVERAQDQAKVYKVSLAEELTRLIIHGLLHLKGYDDLSDTDRRIMKQKEDELVRLTTG